MYFSLNTIQWLSDPELPTSYRSNRRDYWLWILFSLPSVAKRGAFFEHSLLKSTSKISVSFRYNRRHQECYIFIILLRTEDTLSGKNEDLLHRIFS